MLITNIIKPRFVLSVLRSLHFKIKYRGQLKINPLKVFLDQGVRINIGSSGKIIFSSQEGRIYIGRGCDLGASQGGVMEIRGGVFLNKGCTIEAREHVYVGADTMFGPNVSVFDNDHGFSQTGIPYRHQQHKCKPIRIGTNVWIGAGTFVVKGSLIEDSVVIGANSLVSRRLNNGSLYVGNPAKLVRKL